MNDLLQVFTIALMGGGFLLILSSLRVIFQENRSDRVISLLYHRFLPQEILSKENLREHDLQYVCSAEDFEHQMKYLHEEGYATISLADFVSFQKGGTVLPPKPILITCDDGFMSNFLYAFPIWKKYGMKATIFVTADPNSENYRKYAPLDLPLTNAQMLELSENGISIESHGMTHRYLTDLDSDLVKWELMESKKVLAGIIKKPVRFLAIPSGAYNSMVKKVVKEVGYDAAFCSLKGSNNFNSDPYALRRLVIGTGLSIEEFKKLLRPSGIYQTRLMGTLQNFLLTTLGPRQLDGLRDILYRTKLIHCLTIGRTRLILAGLLVLGSSVFLGFVFLYQ